VRHVAVDLLRDKDILISDFHCTAEPSFRVGCIGAITPVAVSRAVQEIGNTLVRMAIRA
jgi:2-aminoethylphosphonate-pyruvate transaminase